MNKKTTIEIILENLEVPYSDEPDLSFFTVENLKDMLLNILQDCGIPEEHVALTTTNEINPRYQFKYSKNSRTNSQVKIKIDLKSHFLEILRTGKEDYDFFQVKELIKKNLITAYGQSIHEYLTSTSFFENHEAHPMIVNQTQRLISINFANSLEFGSYFSSCIMGDEVSSNKKDSMKICIDNFCFFNFSEESMNWVKYDKKMRDFYRDIESLRNLIVPPLSVIDAMEKNAEINSIIATHLKRWGYEPSIIRGEGFNKSLDTWPPELEYKALNPFLFSHEAILCNNKMVVDFCSLAHGEQTPICIGPKYIWKSYWENITIIPLATYQEEQSHIHVEEKTIITRSL